MEHASGTDEMIIRQIFNQLAQAWDTQDVGLFSSLFTSDVDYITFIGEHIKGLDANIKLHSTLWNSYFMKGATLEGEILSIKFPDRNTSVMIARGAVKLRFHKKTPVNKLSINTTVLVKQDGVWKICSFQNTRIIGYNIFMRFMMWIDKKMAK
ncbi:SgcJ/EcaC family oxidoreductase [Pedobacter heparinus]|uniref:SgcJ/EcaC family oxidoreductase n=1 Tax=Pedobacter heparinus TaxID=984 RepID=UPI00293155AF|nr:SgcJ/EcaC family oxidoreductase [Pedobacter heparinus]